MDENLNQEQEQPTLSPIEEKAIQMGWRPKDQFEGDEEEFIDAKEFVRRQPLFDRIENQNKQLKIFSQRQHASQYPKLMINKSSSLVLSHLKRRYPTEELARKLYSMDTKTKALIIIKHMMQSIQQLQQLSQFHYRNIT